MANDLATTQRAAQPGTPKQAVVELKHQFEAREEDFRAALPEHVSVERFNRILMTAVTSNDGLLIADRKSLLEAAMRAAQDGLLPDGREGAFVLFKKQVQWMPMIGGLLKTIRNSGELLSISARVAHENDEFTYRLGDDERIDHVPTLDGEPGPARLVYAIAKTKDGGIYREIMTVREIEEVRAVSRAAGAGPWTKWWGEMAKKTVLRRLAKRLPMSAQAEQVIRRDDGFYDLQSSDALPERQPLRARLGAAQAATSIPAGFNAEFVADQVGASIDLEPRGNIVEVQPQGETDGRQTREPPAEVDGQAEATDTRPDTQDFQGALKQLCAALAEATTADEFDLAQEGWRAAIVGDVPHDIALKARDISHLHESRIEALETDHEWAPETIQKAVARVLAPEPIDA